MKHLLIPESNRYRVLYLVVEISLTLNPTDAKSI
jgi:hypothetical protein